MQCLKRMIKIPKNLLTIYVVLTQDVQAKKKMHTKKCITKWGTFMGKDEYHQSKQASFSPLLY